jgi:hypothetical protein
VIFYRYLETRFALEALQAGHWKIGRLNKLNDIFDCRPRLVNHPRGMEGMDNKYLESIGETLGLLCYCAVNDDPTVWGHYGDQHRGMALGFEFKEGERCFPHRVSYKDKRPELDLSKIGIDPEDRDHETAQTKLIEQGFTSKHPSWEYEQEYRDFVPLNACRMQGEHYFARVLWDRLNVVVLGANCPVSMGDIERIIRQRDGAEFSKEGGHIYPFPEIRKCKPNSESYVLDFETHPRKPQ